MAVIRDSVGKRKSRQRSIAAAPQKVSRPSLRKSRNGKADTRASHDTRANLKVVAVADMLLPDEDPNSPDQKEEEKITRHDNAEARSAEAKDDQMEVETARVETARVETARVETAGVETARVETARVETAGVETAGVETQQDGAKGDEIKGTRGRKNKMRESNEKERGEDEEKAASPIHPDLREGACQSEAKFTTADQTMSTTDVPTSLADESIVSAFNISDECPSVVSPHDNGPPIELITQRHTEPMARAEVPASRETESEPRGDSATIQEMRNVAVLLRKHLRLVENRVSSLESSYLSISSNCNILTGYNPVPSFPRRSSLAPPITPSELEAETHGRVDLSTTFLRGLMSSGEQDHMWAVPELYPQACRLSIPSGTDLEILLSNPVPLTGTCRKTAEEDPPTIRECLFSLSSCTSKPLLHLLQVAPTHKNADPRSLGLGNPIATPHHFTT